MVPSILFNIFLLLGIDCFTNFCHVSEICFLGSKKIHNMFCLPYEKNNMNPYKIAQLAIAKMKMYPEKLNLLIVLDVLLFDEIGQLSAEDFAVIDIILRHVRESDVVFGGILILSTMDHTQLQPVVGRPFLLSTLVVTCFRMAKLETSVRLFLMYRK